MELLYNPDSMHEEEIKKTFVARQGLIDELASLIGSQPDGAGVQHVVIIAPRGMGKTTVLLMLQFAIRDTELAKRWQAVRFSEESYGIYDLSDFWIEALNRLSAQTDDAELLERAEALRVEYPNNEDLQEAGLALIKDWRRKHGKRLVLLVDNFDMILEQINDERDNARLRDVLMNDGTLMLIGGATTFFREARAYDQPLYNFFKIYNLENLRFGQMQELLRNRAELDKIPNFEATLKANEARLRVLEYFTGGSPRLVLMLYRVVTQSDISEVRRGLEKLLDQVTPYYKSKIESLPAQQRKILDYIAHVSGRTREGVRPAEIAEATRLKPNQVSAQLKRLSELGYVRAANLRERNSYYTLSEPLYAIWHQMRFGRDARQRMRWLVDFLKVWYDADEMRTESKRLSDSFRDHLTAGRLPDARNALDHQRLLMEAMEESLTKARTRESVISSYLELQEFEILKKEVLTSDMLPNLSKETLDALCKAGCITVGDVERAKASAPSSAEAQRKAELAAIMKLALSALDEGKPAEALPTLERVLEIMPNAAEVWGCHGLALYDLQRYQDAVQSFARALHFNPNIGAYWAFHGESLRLLDRYEEAIASFDRVLQIDPKSADAWYGRGVALLSLRRYEEALSCFDSALAVEPNHENSNAGRGITLLSRSLVSVAEGHLVRARSDWRQALKSLNRLGSERLNKAVNFFLISVAQIGQLEFTRQLIKESELEEVFFPLARALDYLLTGDKSLIEKLSPEVREVVEDVVAKLQQANDTASQKVNGKTEMRKSASPRKSARRKRAV